MEVFSCHGVTYVDVCFFVCFVCLYTLIWTSSVLMIRHDCSNTVCTCRCSKIWGCQCFSLLLTDIILVSLLMARLAQAKPIQ